MSKFQKAMLMCAIAALSSTVKSQSAYVLSPTLYAGQTATTTRYFKLTLVLRYPSAKGVPEPDEQSITTEVAVMPDRAGSCKTRMTSKVPVTGGPETQFSKVGTKFIELGTKFDCNNIHVEGDGLAFSLVLQTSRFTGEMIKIGGTNRDGTPIEEPIITQRNLELSVRLPLEQPKVIFDSNTKALQPLKTLQPLKPLEEGSKRLPVKMEEPPLQIEMTATELK